MSPAGAMRVVYLDPKTAPPEDRGYTPDLVVWPVEVPPDSKLLPRAGTVLTAADLFDRDRLERDAWQMANELWQGLPTYRGLNLLSILEDAVTEIFVRVLMERACVDAMVRHAPGGGDLTIHCAGSLGPDAVARLTSAPGWRLREIPRPVAADGERWRRRLKILAHEGRRGVQSVGTAVLERLDESFRLLPHVGRHLLPRSAGAFRRAPVLAYSAAEVFTGTILAYQEKFRPLCFVVNGTPAARPLTRQRIPHSYLWEWTGGGRYSTREVRRHITDLVTAVRENDHGQLLHRGGQLDRLSGYSFPTVARLVWFVQNMFDHLRPEQVVVANQGSSHEAIVLTEARRRGIPSVMLQHGVFGADMMEHQPLRADELWVRGPFWMEVMPEETARRTRVVPRGAARIELRGTLPERETIVFLTSPNNGSPARIYPETREVVLHCASIAREIGRRLVVRVHPRERVAVYADWLGGVTSSAHRIEQGGPIEATLDGARMVITYSSTIFMECLQRSIPMISLGWHPFRFKSGFQRAGVFMFADSLRELSRLVKAVDGDPGSYSLGLAEKGLLFNGGEGPLGRDGSRRAMGGSPWPDP
jgi:hypothetical protein